MRVSDEPIIPYLGPPPYVPDGLDWDPVTYDTLPAATDGMQWVPGPFDTAFIDLRFHGERHGTISPLPSGPWRWWDAISGRQGVAPCRRDAARALLTSVESESLPVLRDGWRWDRADIGLLHLRDAFGERHGEVCIPCTAPGRQWTWQTRDGERVRERSARDAGLALVRAVGAPHA